MPISWDYLRVSDLPVRYNYRVSKNNKSLFQAVFKHYVIKIDIKKCWQAVETTVYIGSSRKTGNTRQELQKKWFRWAI